MRMHCSLKTRIFSPRAAALTALLAMGLLACRDKLPQQPKVPAPVAAPGEPVMIDLRLADTFAGSDTVAIEVLHDHSLKTSKQYEAIPLLPLLQKAIAAHQLDTLITQVFFECKDGYIPTNSYLELSEKGGGFLAFRDLDAPPDQAWPDNIRAAYAPFYLVWEDIPDEDHHLAWPYGLVQIRLEQAAEAFAALFPQDRPGLAGAFLLYRENCLKCHAINGQGGLMGPEFNAPRNITDYWSRENIIAFARDPQSFRTGSKMPPITHLSDADFHQIVDYLQYLAARKASNGGLNP